MNLGQSQIIDGKYTILNHFLKMTVPIFSASLKIILYSHSENPGTSLICRITSVTEIQEGLSRFYLSLSLEW